MRQTSSATFLLIGDHSQDGTWPSREAAPAAVTTRGEVDRDRTSVSLTSPRAMVVYRPAPSRVRA